MTRDRSSISNVSLIQQSFALRGAVPAYAHQGTNQGKIDLHEIAAAYALAVEKTHAFHDADKRS